MRIEEERREEKGRGAGVPRGRGNTQRLWWAGLAWASPPR
jgi:hypothetical protein